jgi:uncharacterized membrane protein YuzA (DUF378 family)
MKQLDTLSTLLLVVGGLNWGLVGFANFDLVASITGAGNFGNKNLLGAIIYGAVGLSALYQLVRWRSLPSRYATAA